MDLRKQQFYNQVQFHLQKVTDSTNVRKKMASFS